MCCGPASLKIVAAYFGIEKEEEQLVTLCKTNRAIGTTGPNLLAAGRKIGLRGRIVDGADYDTLAACLAAKIPPIVDWFGPGQNRPTSKSRMASGHYSVVIGLSRKRIVLEDPGIGRKRSIPWPQFLQVWFDYDKKYPTKSSDIVLRRLIIMAPPGQLNREPVV